MLFVGIDPAEQRNHYCLAVLNDEKKIQVLTSEKLRAVLSYLAGTKDVIAGINSISKFEHLKPCSKHNQEGTPYFHSKDDVEKKVKNSIVENGSKHEPHEKVTALQDELIKLGYKSVSDNTSTRRFFLAKTCDVFPKLAAGSLLPLDSDAGRWQRQLLLAEQEIAVPDVMQYFEEVTRFRILQGSLPGEMIYQQPELNAVALGWLGWLEKHQPANIRILDESLIEYYALSIEQEND